MCYTGDLTNPSKGKYTLDYYLNLARQLVEQGCHVLCVKVSYKRRPVCALDCLDPTHLLPAQSIHVPKSAPSMVSSRQFHCVCVLWLSRTWLVC